MSYDILKVRRKPERAEAGKGREGQIQKITKNTIQGACFTIVVCSMCDTDKVG